MLKYGQLSHQFQVVETGIQDIQANTAASASLILQAASDISQYLVVAAKSAGGKINMPTLTKIKNALSLEGKANQELNQFRRNMIKLYLPPQFAKLADVIMIPKSFFLEIQLLIQ